MRQPVVFDVETKHTFREFSEHAKLGISMVCAYDYASDQQYSFLESELSGLFRLFENASYVVGFNIISFDMPVLQAYYPGNIMQFPMFDLLDDVKNNLGRRLSLNDLVSTTLGAKKSGNGLMAIDYYRQGKIDELRAYCMDDTMLTKQLFDYGAQNGEIYYMSERGKSSIRVRWKKYLLENLTAPDTHLALPF